MPPRLGTLVACASLNIYVSYYYIHVSVGFIAADQFLPQGRQLYSLWRLEGARSYEGYCRHMTPARSPPSTNRAIVSTPQYECHEYFMYLKPLNHTV